MTIQDSGSAGTRQPIVDEHAAWASIHHPHRGSRVWFLMHLHDFDHCRSCGYARINIIHRDETLGSHEFEE